ncbi:MAG: RluA family pseudouridine synthase [Deltaproteobacteria bacterium]|nr:RluA family pseudouridine synthase [Deltaproteobacteria bacterium]
MSLSNKAEGSSQISGSNAERALIEVGPESAGNRLDHFLASKIPSLSRNRIKHLIKDGFIHISPHSTVKSSLKLKGGEVIELTIPEAEPLEALPENLDMRVLFEDNAIIVIDKEAGMVVHPAAGHSGGTLVNALLYHCSDLSGVGGKLRPGIVHRLDKDTSGVMIVTKNDEAHNKMAAQFKAHSILRKYKALVYGVMAQKGTIDEPLGRHPGERKKIAPVKGGRRAVTHWTLLKAYEGLSLVELTLETGRTHQIRVHLSNKGHAVAGDQTYGSSGRAGEIKNKAIRDKVKAMKRQALHAWALGFNHPVSGEYMEFHSQLPRDIQNIIDLLESQV